MFLQAVIDIGGQLAQEAPHTQFNLGILLGRFAGFILTVAGVAAFGYLVLGGVRWTVAGSDKGKLDAAKQDITNAIIGLLVTASAFAIFAVLQYLFGIDIVKI